MRNTTSTTFGSDATTYRIRHDWESDEHISATVVRAVANVTNTPPTELDPLYESIDVDALDQLFDGPNGDSWQDTSWVSFRYHDCTVEVYATGTIRVTLDEDATPVAAPVPRSLRDR